jgi:hypothetical protein
MIRWLENFTKNRGTLAEAGRSRNPAVLLTLLGPAVRGLLEQRGKNEPASRLPASHAATVDWAYGREDPALHKLYQAAKSAQWDGAELDWALPVDPEAPDRALMRDEMLPLIELPAYRALPAREQRAQRHALVAWLLSQFLHGEQGALLAACQVTEAVGGLDAKLYGSTQVVDEGRHVEVFHRYLTTKLEKLYAINDNLYVVIDALMTDGRWDLKFLGMQIMIEGLALGAFGTMRNATEEPLLRSLLGRVITDEARHVHFGVVALERHYRQQASERDRRDREDWAYEIALLMRNRFLAHEFYEEYWAHHLSRAQWDRMLLESSFMRRFRQTMFRRVVPNLRRIGLLSDRIRPHYAALGLLEYADLPAAPEVTTEELLS